MARVPIREIGQRDLKPTVQWIASESFITQTFHMMDPGNIEPNERHRIVIPSGTPYPANDGTCIGLIMNDSDVTAGSVEVAVMMFGVVYEERLPVALSEAAKEALGTRIIPRNGKWN